MQTSFDSSLPDLPNPVEYVLLKPNTTKKSTPSSAHAHHVRFDDHVQIYEYPRVTKREHDAVWYSNRECRAMMLDALGYNVPSSFGSSSPLYNSRHATAVFLAWVAGSLWIGSLVMGILATKTLANPTNKR